ncbi:hypothetical protein JCM6882_005650 [Rhodosporidiobolus microsporus]
MERKRQDTSEQRLPPIQHLFAAVDALTAGRKESQAAAPSFPSPSLVPATATFSTSRLPSASHPVPGSAVPRWAAPPPTFSPSRDLRIDTSSLPSASSPLPPLHFRAPPSPAPSPRSSASPYHFGRRASDGSVPHRQHRLTPLEPYSSRGASEPFPGTSAQGGRSVSNPTSSIRPRTALARTGSSEQELVDAAITLSSLPPLFRPLPSRITPVQPPPPRDAPPPPPSRFTSASQQPPLFSSSSTAAGAPLSPPVTATAEVFAPRRFVCATCDAPFARKNDLTRHERIHSGEMPFECRRGCGARFRRSDARKRHENKSDC